MTSRALSRGKQATIMERIVYSWLVWVVERRGGRRGWAGLMEGSASGRGQTRGHMPRAVPLFSCLASAGRALRSPLIAVSRIAVSRMLPVALLSGLRLFARAGR